MLDGVGHHRLRAGDAGRQQGQGRGEGEGGQQLLLRLLLLKFLQQQQQLHAHGRKPPAPRALQDAVADEGAQELLVALQPLLAACHAVQLGLQVNLVGQDDLVKGRAAQRVVGFRRDRPVESGRVEEVVGIHAGVLHTG